MINPLSIQAAKSCLCPRATGDPLWTQTNHTHYVGALDFTTDGAGLASGSGDASVCLWDAAIGDALNVLEGHVLVGVTFAEDNLLLTASWDGTILLLGIPPTAPNE